MRFSASQILENAKKEILILSLFYPHPETSLNFHQILPWSFILIVSSFSKLIKSASDFTLDSGTSFHLHFSFVLPCRTSFYFCSLGLHVYTSMFSPGWYRPWCLIWFLNISRFHCCCTK
jgi:hypothetical protein